MRSIAAKKLSMRAWMLDAVGGDHFGTV